MNRILGPLFVTALGALIVLLNTVYIVPEGRQALVLRFGSVQYVINQDGGTAGPGLYVKAPFVDQLLVYDKRNLDLDIKEKAMVTADQQQLLVDAMVIYRITRPIQYYRTVVTGEAGRARLASLAEAALRRQLGGVPQRDLLTGRRGDVMRAIAADLNREAAAQLGVTVVDVRILQADFPQATQERVFARMITEREQVAAGIRAGGEQQAIQIKAEADREAAITVASAKEQAEKLKGEGDAERARLFAQAFGKDPDFAAFYRSMQAYEKALPAGTQVIVPPDSDFFRYMRSRETR